MLERSIPKNRAAEFLDVVEDLAHDTCIEPEPDCPRCELRKICPTAQTRKDEAAHAAKHPTPQAHVPSKEKPKPLEEKAKEPPKPDKEKEKAKAAKSPAPAPVPPPASAKEKEKPKEPPKPAATAKPVSKPETPPPPSKSSRPTKGRPGAK